MLFSFVDWPKEISEWNQPGTRTGLKVSEKEANVQWKTDLQKPWRTIAQEQLYNWKQNIKKQNNCGSTLLIFGNQSDILIWQDGQVPSFDCSFFSKPLCVHFFSCIVDTEKTDHTKLIHWFLSFSCVCTSNAYLHSTCVNFSPGHTWMPSDGGWSTQGSNDFSPARQHGALLSEKEEKATKKELVVLFHYPPAYKEIYIWVQATQQNYTSKLLYKWKKRPKQLRLASIAPSICMHLRVCVCLCG